jgi:hypothetical protein
MSEREGHERHEGTFAEGQEEEEHHPEREQGPDFARGQEDRPEPPQEEEHKGTFAEGQEEEEHHPEREPGPDFARGQDED